MRDIKEIITPDFIAFIEEHHQDDTKGLILSGKRYPAVNIKAAATIIEARKKLLKKVPEWGKRYDLYYPATLAIEQASSVRTALYKQQFINKGVVIDLTGGLGIDSYHIAKKAKRIIYIERESELCAAAEYNFEQLGSNNIEVYNREITPFNVSSVITEILSYNIQEEEKQSIITNDISNNSVSDKYASKRSLNRVDLIYIDPSRRGTNDRRIFAISDCEPDITKLNEHLFDFTDKILVKVSPMADITLLLKELPDICTLHILSVENECKELLLLLTQGNSNNSGIPIGNSADTEQAMVEISCINFTKQDGIQSFTFTYDHERLAEPEYAEHLGSYLYEPNSSILKGGAFKTISSRFEIAKLEKSTHLYTSDNIIEGFPGKVFKIKEVLDYNAKTIRNLNKIYPKANISVRNFPLSVNELKKRAAIEDGGNIQLMGTTILNNGISLRKIIMCERI